jgi:hypothetical protein
VAFFPPNYLLLLVFPIEKVSIVINQRQRKRKRKDKFRMNFAKKEISFGVISKLKLMICIYAFYVKSVVCPTFLVQSSA